MTADRAAVKPSGANGSLAGPFRDAEPRTNLVVETNRRDLPIGARRRVGDQEVDLGGNAHAEVELGRSLNGRIFPGAAGVLGGIEIGFSKGEANELGGDQVRRDHGEAKTFAPAEQDDQIRTEGEGEVGAQSETGANEVDGERAVRADKGGKWAEDR